ncbi:hypothetical protein AUJ14_01505 [Candidatus Micrarchaeota archaeon CG1_02_55_22]|nr:MAG: hypothetical protein AUJ14_01505 [Candidatus Micrarchaeota archaeon CG1_02_55_22]
MKNLFAASVAFVLLASFSSAMGAEQARLLVKGYSGVYSIDLPGELTSIVGTDVVLRAMVDETPVGYAVVHGGKLMQVTPSSDALVYDVDLIIWPDAIDRIVASSDPQKTAVREFALGHIGLRGYGFFDSVKLVVLQWTTYLAVVAGLA